MMTLFNIWHYIAILVTILFLAGGVYFSLVQPNKKLRLPMMMSFLLIALVIGGFSLVLVDNSTKVVKLYRLENKRLLNIEQIVYTGMIKNEGKYEIGEVTLELQLINRGNMEDEAEIGAFWSPSSFIEIFGGRGSASHKSQTITKTFVVAKNLKPGDVESFRVNFDYPPYFRGVREFANVYGH